jgi:3-hydroxyacyl-CoA dehydrogenase/enoyl-CoA hydratase/3-hydroxybutyryl-CoA epimerase
MLPRLAARRALAGRGELYTLLTRALAMLLDGRRRGALDALSLGLVDEVAPADALSHALGVARRIADGTFTGSLWSPLAAGATTVIAFPNVERDPEIQRLLAHHARVPRTAPAKAVLEAVRVGLSKGLETGLAFEAREFGALVASDDGRAGIDRFFARRSLPLPPRSR